MFPNTPTNKNDSQGLWKIKFFSNNYIVYVFYYIFVTQLAHNELMVTINYECWVSNTSLKRMDKKYKSNI